ncbi:MAG TPA: hypothetical protein VIF37_03850 [Methylobacter sp.]|jgi:hypothetical protein
MRAELDELLCRTYPALYRDRHGDRINTLMCWGFACGDGWYDLIDTVSILLIRHQPDTCAVQVKEKFGGLRFYHSSCDDYACGIVSMAERISLITCDVCGVPADVLLINGWLVTRCEAHVEPHNTGGKKNESMVTPAYGLGLGWSRLVIILEQIADWHIEKNGMPKASFKVAVKNGRLSVLLSGGNAMTEGMVAFINHYAQRTDQYTGKLLRIRVKGPCLNIK